MIQPLDLRDQAESARQDIRKDCRGTGAARIFAFLRAKACSCRYAMDAAAALRDGNGHKRTGHAGRYKGRAAKRQRWRAVHALPAKWHSRVLIRSPRCAAQLEPPHEINRGKNS
jgi:hypothetical protein